MNNVIYMWAPGQVPSQTERLGLSATIRYFDQDLVRNLLNSTIIEPVLEFVNA